MANQLSMDRFLEIEDDPAILSVVCPTTGLPMWSAARNTTLRLMIEDHLQAGGPPVGLGRWPRMRRMVPAAVRAALHNGRHPPRRSDVLIVGTGAGLIPHDGRLFNRLLDHFAVSLGDRAWTAESLFGDEWPSAPRANDRIRFMADQRLKLAIQGRVSVRPIHQRLAYDLINLIEVRGRDCVGWEMGRARRVALVKMTARKAATFPAQARFAQQLIRRVRPRIAIVEEGCYGGMAVFNATARDLGVRVAEFQHGLVTRAHDAYNVAPHLAASEVYRRTQPTTFLSYGRWWNNQFNAPVDEKVVIGNPHRSEKLRDWRPMSNRTTVVVLGAAAQTEGYVAMCRQLAALLTPSLRVLFRPHPLERSRLEAMGDRSVHVDSTPDLYDSLACAQAVIGEASTALFEAVGTVPKIFVWDTPKSRFYLGDHPFERFTEPDEVAGMLSTQDRGVVHADVAGAVWASNWRARFLSYVGAHS